MTTEQLLINVLLYVFLPLWGIAGFADWVCHRRTNIESTSGLFETFLHSLMGLQMAIPIILCLLFEINVLVLLICIGAWFFHELIAHWDIRYASPRREISIWEMHAHCYLGTLPLYMLIMIIVVNWSVFLDLINFNWVNQFHLTMLDNAHGFDGYIHYYLMFMSILCVFPYCEENIRCLYRYWQTSKASK